MYDILFLSRLIPEEMNEEVRSKMSNTMDDAAMIWQKHIIEGLEMAESKSTLTIFNFLPVKSWPKNYKDAFVHKKYFSHNGEAKDINLPFCNIQFIKRFFQGNSMYKAVKKWASDGKKNKVIIAYSLYPEFIQSVKIAKISNQSITSCAIVLDLPEYSILTKKIDLTGQIYLNWSKYKANKLLPYIDRYALLTKQMTEPLKIDKPYCIIEGICSTEFEKNNQISNEKKIVFYAGTLHERFGILNLLNAFSCISGNEYQLVICGYGDSENEIKEAQQKDNRICFMGQLERKDVLPLMLSASVILNPRQNGEEFTKYSFPSKDMEALSSGIPFIGYKLDGIPDEYDAYINYPKSNSIEDLAELIQDVCADISGQYCNKALLAKKWVVENKSSKMQAQKLLDIL